VDEVAWYSNNSGGNTQMVGIKAPNELGIMDMSGNVFEWVFDAIGNERRVRGGSCLTNENTTTVNARFNFYTPEIRVAGFGFRLARSSEP
jgi:formylglycine-generating enzyme required for sulfatase activity